MRPEVGGDLTAAAIETLPDGKVSYSADLVQRVAKFAACRLQNSRSLLHHWAEKDYAVVFSGRSVSKSRKKLFPTTTKK